jgi:D-amino-acid dehydrogenase
MNLPVVVVGAGIVGVAAAIWLQRGGHQVVMIDRLGPGEATSHGNGGVLASASIVPVTTPGLMRSAPKMLIDPRQPLFMKWRHLPALVPWLRQYLSHCNPQDVNRIADALFAITGDSLADHQALARGTGAEQWIVPSDYLYLYRDRVHFEKDRFGWSIRKAHGFRWDEFESEEFRQYDPVFNAEFRFAVRLADHGRIADPGRYVKDLAAHFEAAGGRILRGDVTDFVIDEGAATGVVAKGEAIGCSAVVLAAGVWSAQLATKLGLKVPLESERGYHLELWEPSVMPRSPVMVASGKFVATPMDGRIRLAGIVEFGGLDAPASRAPINLLRRNAIAAMPDLTWKETKEWMGHRPALPDSIPVIGAAPCVRNAFVGFGHHHIGLTSGPKTGRLLAQLVSGQAPNMDLAPYAPTRFH